MFKLYISVLGQYASPPPRVPRFLDPNWIWSSLFTQERKKYRNSSEVRHLLQVPEMCNDLKWSLFYITKSGTYSRKLVWENKLPGPALGVDFPQCLHLNDYRSIGLFHLDALHLDDRQSIGSFPQSKFQVYYPLCNLANWVSQSIRICPKNTQHCFAFWKILLPIIPSSQKEAFLSPRGGLMLLFKCTTLLGN